VWNKDSPGWVNGAGLVARGSPGFIAARNVIHTVETGMFLLDSPRSRFTHNTVLWNMYGAAYFLRSAAGSVCRNNCFAFSGNQMMRIGTAADDELSRFDCDYNNLGTRLRDPSPPHSLQPEDPLLRVNSKTMVEMNGVYFSSLEEWRKAGGKDRHSIFADPKFISPAAREFRLRPDSPNRGAGENGTTIGALDAVTPSPPANGASRGRNATLANGPREILSGSIHATAPRSSWEGPE
jgi:hypothetical protein